MRVAKLLLSQEKSVLHTIFGLYAFSFYAIVKARKSDEKEGIT